ncbi:MAG: S-methyl-5-thioribose-1-phosphate isomerase [Candidatus Cloacimonadota bacterium]|nr:MAG: S-methyl-5-thioribose-1-phosphate isomerase [Candidatus Cloacimonadota bacterium]
MNYVKSIDFDRQKAEIIDQTLLPNDFKLLKITDYREMIEAIKTLRIRGAPAIGIAASVACYLAAKEIQTKNGNYSDFLEAVKEIEASRPTAVNLFYACNGIRAINAEIKNLPAKVYDYAEKLRDYEIDACRKMGENGARLISKKSLKILTHCNTGSLATVGIGTALGMIRVLAESHDVHVFVDETRPLLQGARLTAWELGESGIPYSLITDNMVASVIRSEKIDMIITGADRIAANGDSANKIGTFNLAVLAKYFGIPLYIVAPETTLDSKIRNGEEIIIEERSPSEVKQWRDVKTAPENANAKNPAFDVTPSELIKAIITEKNVYSYPYQF